MIERREMNAKRGRIQARLARLWGNYVSDLGGEVYTETLCRTTTYKRCPNIAYLTPDLVAHYGDFKVLPHSFPLIADIISPTDEVEEVFSRASEYLASQCQEVWLVMPESRVVLVITSDFQKLYSIDEVLSTHAVLTGFTVPVRELLA
jgi:Putative restriction endonuclease